MTTLKHQLVQTRGFLPTEILPCRVGVVRTQEQLVEVCKVRKEGYSHHVADMAASLGEPELVDWDKGTVIFYVQDKNTGAMVGTSRLQSNLFSPMVMELELAETEHPLPKFLTTSYTAEAARFAVLPGYKHEFRAIFRILGKTMYLYCLAKGIKYMLLGARNPALVRAYHGLGCEDIDKTPRVLGEGGGLPHRIMFHDILAAEARWKAQGKPEYDWFINTYHPDLEIFGGLVGAWAQPRSS